MNQYGAAHPGGRASVRPLSVKEIGEVAGGGWEFNESIDAWQFHAEGEEFVGLDINNDGVHNDAIVWAGNPYTSSFSGIYGLPLWAFDSSRYQYTYYC